MSADAISKIMASSEDGPLACLGFLVGDGFADELAQAIMACLDADAVKELIVECLTGDENPLTKEILAKIIQAG